MDRQLQVSLVVERHRRDLAERVFAVEHPAVGAAQQRVGDVANARLNRGAGPGRRAGALDPLPLKVARDLAADEVAVPGIANLDRGAADRRVGIEEADRLLARRAVGAALDALGHQPLAIRVETRQDFQCAHGVGSEDVGVVGSNVSF